MQYKSEERYIFNVDREKDALKLFKQELRESGIPFEENGGSLQTTIIIRTGGVFDMQNEETKIIS